MWWIVFGWFILFADTTFAQTSARWDCSENNTPENLSRIVNQEFEERWVEQLFYTDKQIEAVQRSLNTYCCREFSWLKDSWNERCNDVYPVWKNVIQSNSYLDHFLSIYVLYLRWDPEVCKVYDFECATRLDLENDYPWKSVCFRKWSSVDPRCESIYDMGTGVDLLAWATHISSPWQYRALYEKFWSDTNSIAMPNAKKVVELDPSKVSLVQMWYHMCAEVDFIYSNVLGINIDSNKAVNADNNPSGSLLQKCRAKSLDYYQSHGVDYVHTLSLAKWVDQMTQINTQNREHIMDVMYDLKMTMSTVQTAMTNVLRRRDAFTNTCSM